MFHVPRCLTKLHELLGILDVVTIKNFAKTGETFQEFKIYLRNVKHLAKYLDAKNSSLYIV